MLYCKRDFIAALKTISYPCHPCHLCLCISFAYAHWVMPCLSLCLSHRGQLHQQCCDNWTSVNADARNKMARMAAAAAWGLGKISGLCNVLPLCVMSPFIMVEQLRDWCDPMLLNRLPGLMGLHNQHFYTPICKMYTYKPVYNFLIACLDCSSFFHTSFLQSLDFLITN